MRIVACKKLYILLSGIFICLISCTPQACLDETESYLKVSFFSYTTKKSLPPDSLTVYGLNMDTSFIYNKSRTVNIARLPLNAAADSSVFVLTINKITDTLTIRHFSYPHLISKECGYTFYHNILELPIPTFNTIDSIGMPKGTITTLNEENVRIYY